MSKSTSNLTALGVKQTAEPGLYGDGDGLYLRVAPGGSKSWVFRYQRGGERRHMGLGSETAVSLAGARHRATEARRALAEGKDPIELRQSEKLAAVAAEAGAVTFAQAAADYVEAHRSGWRNTKHGKQWLATLEAYAFPVFGKIPVADIDVPLVLKVLQPIWVRLKSGTVARPAGAPASKKAQGSRG